MTATVQDEVPTFPVEIMGPDQATPIDIGTAMTLVMQDVQAIRKAGVYDDNRGTRYQFRGIDDVVNAVGPVLRKYGVRPIPRLIERTVRDTKTGAGRDTREVLVTVEYTLRAPDGSEEVYVVPGESLDTSDKGTAKAMSVAYRILWLQALCIPTDDPDPDASHLERSGTGPMPAALVAHIQRGLRAPAAHEPSKNRWYLALHELHGLWQLVQAYSAAELAIPGSEADQTHGAVTWHTAFANRYAEEIARVQSIEQCKTLWAALGEHGLAGFRWDRQAVGDHLKQRGTFLEQRNADNLKSIARSTEAAKTAAEVHEVRRTLMNTDALGHVFGPGLEAAYAALEGREKTLNARMVRLYGTPGYGDIDPLAEAYRNALEQLTDLGLVAAFRADVEDNIELASNEQEDLLAALDKRATWLQAELDGPAASEPSNTEEAPGGTP